MTGGRRRTRTWIGTALVAGLLAVPAVNIVGGGSAQAADARPGDGTTSATAGASCWGIKQQHPASATGLYWLNTTALQRPQQFHCDMTTNGGGWVLIGRGRQGWTFNPFGQGSPQTVRTTVDGPAAFAPAALDSATITALLGGQPVDQLTDGIRLERSTNTSGTSRQQFVLFPRYRDWTWTLDPGQLLNRVVIDGTTYNGSNTRDTSASVAGQTTNQLSGLQGVRRMFTYAWASHANQRGFSFGSGVNGGSSSATNHLWTSSNEGSPIPFTRVWVRPRIANDAAGFTPIPSEGFAAESKPATLKNRSERANWGVVGYDRTNEDRIEPWNTNVFAIRNGGDRVFVGGRFAGVQNGPSASPVPQRFLAAFSRDGNWIDSFRPSLDGRVWDMAMTADGKLIIAGDFTNVNGAPNTAGLAALDPQTGQVISSWKANVANTSGKVLVRGLAIRGDTIYAIGRFNRVTGGTWNTITVSSAVSVSAADGTPQTWRPRLSGQGVRLRVTNDGTRVLLAGYFSNVNADTNHANFAVTDVATGNPVAGIGRWIPSEGSGTKTYQQAVTDLPDGRMIVGGSEHNIQLWNRNRTQLLDAAVTKQGGDTQAIEVFDGVAYIGCHCGNWVYEGTNNWTTPTGFRSVEPINLVGAWDPTTWDYDTSWYPSSLKGASGEGVWAMEQDDRGCLWVGGDLNRGSYSGNAETDFLGGFARFCQEDTTAPTAPTNLRATAEGGNVNLTWGASTDASGTVSYDIYRDDRVIATVWGRSFTDAGVTEAHRYTVRAADARGNRSASPAPIAVNGPPVELGQLVTFGSTWRYLDDGTDPGDAWRQPGFADGTWRSGPGKFGWGRPDVVTAIGPNKPLIGYFRTSFDVADPAQVKAIDAKLSVATGAAVYLNGVEVGRVNMPSGAITATTPGAGYIWGAEETALKTVVIPGSLLRAGTNTLAVSVHNMTPGASRLFFDLQATAIGASTDATPPSAPSLTATPGAGKVDLAWTAATDDVALGGYLITRDGQPYAVTAPTATTWTDGTVDLGVPHAYTVTAFDMNGNVRASAAANVNPIADPNLLAYGDTWRWSYVAGGPGEGWNQPGYDDSAWAAGPGELGFGDNDEATIISTSPTPRPTAAYFRTTIDIADPAAYSQIVADLIRDDSAVVFVNGVEVARDNLPEGPITYDTPALRGITDRAEERTPIRFAIPSTAFVPGTNTIAVQVNLIHAWSGDLSMALKLTGQP